MAWFELNRHEYSFNETEVTENGGRAKGDPSHPSDPPRCLQNCREQFLEQASGAYKEDFSKACISLAKDGPNQLLWPLYWCDSTFCGVHIDENGSLGQDPNVDLIINQCQNVGYYSVFDPGPPPAGFSCPTVVSGPAGSTGQQSKWQPLAQTATSAVRSDVPSTISDTPTSLALTTATRAHIATSSAALATPLSSDAPPEPSAAPAPNLSTASKVAIGACSGLGLLALISLSLFLFRWRKQRRAASPTGVKAHIRLRRDPEPDMSPSPLISASRSTATASIRSALAPPLRLGDRKFLPSILRPSNRSPSPPLTPLTPVNSYPSGVFPSSPICSPTTNRLVPRHERGLKSQGYPVSGQGPALINRSRGSLSGSFAPSIKSSTTTQSSHRNETLVGSATPSLQQIAPGSPARPPRSHEAPLEIPDLVKPDTKPGPPPTMTLPTAPAPVMGEVTREGFPRGASWGSWDEGWYVGGDEAHGIGIAISPPESRLYFPKEMVLGWGPGIEVAVEAEGKAEARLEPSSLSSLDEGVEPASRRVSVLREEVLERLGGGY